MNARTEPEKVLEAAGAQVEVFAPNKDVGPEGPAFNLTSTNDLMRRDFPPVQCDGLLPEGLSILAGRQKLGKSWLALDLACAVASGGLALGKIPCGRGDVLYIDLENGERREQDRIATLFPDSKCWTNLERLMWTYESPKIKEGFLQALENWRLRVVNPRLVIVDVFKRIKPPTKGAKTAYEADYEALADVQKWATETHRSSHAASYPQGRSRRSARSLERFERHFCLRRYHHAARSQEWLQSLRARPRYRGTQPCAQLRKWPLASARRCS